MPVKRRHFDPFGIRKIIAHLTGKTAGEPFFSVRGSYRWVRHPLYFFCLLMIWTPVSVTTDRLVFNGLWTLWIVIGAFLEERDLIASFGDAYDRTIRSMQHVSVAPSARKNIWPDYAGLV